MNRVVARSYRITILQARAGDNVALELEDRWVWDFWIAQDNETYHLFFLQAPRSLGNAELRHRSASVGHAISTDLVNWTEVGTALEAGLPGEWDDVATWTGSVLKHDDRWWMFYTGTCHEEDGLDSAGRCRCL